MRQKDLDELTQKIVVLPGPENNQLKIQCLGEKISSLKLTLEVLNETILNKSHELQVCKSIKQVRYYWTIGITNTKKRFVKKYTILVNYH